MDTLKEFQKMMAEQTDLALATVGTDGIPNVRIVNYYFNPENNIVYFATFKNNENETKSECCFYNNSKKRERTYKSKRNCYQEQTNYF